MLTEPGVTVEIGGVTVSADTVVSLIRTGQLSLDGLPARELTIVLQLVEIARRRTDAVLTEIVDRATGRVPMRWMGTRLFAVG